MCSEFHYSVILATPLQTKMTLARFLQIIADAEINAQNEMYMLIVISDSFIRF